MAVVLCHVTDFIGFIALQIEALPFFTGFTCGLISSAWAQSDTTEVYIPYYIEGLSVCLPCLSCVIMSLLYVTEGEEISLHANKSVILTGLPALDIRGGKPEFHL